MQNSCFKGCCLADWIKINYSIEVMIKKIVESDYKNALLDRFIRYVKICSESDSNASDKGIFPSTESQQEFARLLADEIKKLGLLDVQVTKDSYVYGFLPASVGLENIPPFCLLAHIDTVDEVSGKNVQPLIHPSYDGVPIDLKCGVCLDPKKDEALAIAAKNRETIITSDGTTLLGADDKAGIAEIVTFFECLCANKNIRHGPVEVIFSPDEETGHGMDKVPLELLKSKFAYTVDGGHAGEIETECFNAYGAIVSFRGKSFHTGEARKKGMVNAICAASRFIESIPNNQRPETTDGYQGFYAVMEMTGSIENSKISLLIRDFSEDGMKNRLQMVNNLAFAAASSFGAECSVEFKEQYKNMKSVLDGAPKVTEWLVSACKKSGIEPVFVPIRGGTDGSRLSEMGIPTPNIFTGGHNYHSRSEWASLEQMCMACDVLLHLAEEIALE